MSENSWVAAQLAASQEGLSPMKLATFIDSISNSECIAPNGKIICWIINSKYYGKQHSWLVFSEMTEEN
jgi:hypothetical protein